MIPSDSKNAHAAPGFASGAAAVVRPGEPGAEERPYRRPDEEDPRRNGSAGPDGYGSKEVEGLNLSKANMKKLFLLVAGGVVLNALLQHLDLVGYFLYVVLGMIAPFLAGSAIAFIINVPMRQIEMRLFPELPEGRKPGRLRRAKRPISFIVTLVLLGGLLAVIFFLILPEIGRTLQSFVDRIPAFAQQTQEWAETMMAQYPEIVDEISRISINWEQIMQGLMDFAQNSMSGVLNSTLDIASSIIGGVVGSVVAVVFAAYVLLQKERLGRQFRQLLYAFLPEKHADRIVEVGTLSFRTFSGFLSGQCLEAVILGCMFFLTMSILRFPYALTISVLITVTALIPIFGAFIGCIIGAFLILTVEPMQALWFIVLFLILQQVEGNLIYPHVVGNSVGLPSLWVLAAVTIGGSVMGIVGMLIFIPLCSVAYTILRHHVLIRLRERNIPKEKILFPRKLSDVTFIRHGKSPVVDMPPEDEAVWECDPDSPAGGDPAQTERGETEQEETAGGEQSSGEEKP